MIPDNLNIYRINSRIRASSWRTGSSSTLAKLDELDLCACLALRVWFRAPRRNPSISAAAKNSNTSPLFFRADLINLHSRHKVTRAPPRSTKSISRWSCFFWGRGRNDELKKKKMKMERVEIEILKWRFRRLFWERVLLGRFRILVKVNSSFYESRMSSKILFIYNESQIQMQ